MPPEPVTARITPYAAATANAATPQSTCSTRNSCTDRSIAARSRRRRTEADPPSTRSTPSAAERRAGPNTPAAAAVGEDETTLSDGVRPTCGRSRT